MAESIQNIPQPELFFGFVAPIGTDISDSIKAFEDRLKAYGYDSLTIKITDLFPSLSTRLPFNTLKQTPLEERYDSHIEFGDNLRKHFDDDSFLAACCVQKVILERQSRILNESEVPARTAYLLHQFKRKEEIELLRSVYGQLFFQVSVHSKRSSRVDNLARKIALSHNQADHNRYRDSAERLVRRDENEAGVNHGQRVSDVFHQADFIVNADANDPAIEDQINRFLDLIFGSNSLSPTKSEYGLYMAKSASLRSIDLSRQVGAAVFSKTGEIIAFGANEVPKAGGGTYWCDDPKDNRDFCRKEDSNDRRKRELLSELAPMINSRADLKSLLDDPRIKDSQFMDALEYGRVIHAEMSAISDAARLGRPLKGSVLFCTTFPCHMCAKHIVAAGVDEVVYLEPYPKSLAGELHGDSISIEGQSRGEYGDFRSCNFRHFHGVSPRRFREFFETKKKRKDKSGAFVEWRAGQPQPIVELKYPTYLLLENHIISGILSPALRKAGVPIEVFKNEPTRSQHAPSMRPASKRARKAASGRSRRS